jgi:hypothetical protein
MASSLFKVTVVQHWLHDCWIGPQGRPCATDTPGARFVRSRRMPAGTPGAVKVTKKSKKWYGRVPGSPKAVPLSANKVAAQQLLAEMVRKAELRRAGIGDPFEAHRHRWGMLPQAVAGCKSNPAAVAAEGGGGGATLRRPLRFGPTVTRP